MVRILKAKHRENKEDIYNILDKIDSQFISINQELRRLEKEFVNGRDIYLIKKLRKNAEWSTNKTLLLKGRITRYDLGSPIYREGEFLEFIIGFHRRIITSTIKYEPLINTNHKGKKFSRFMEKDLGAVAKTGKVERTNQTRILSILIPKSKKDLIIS